MLRIPQTARPVAHRPRSAVRTRRTPGPGPARCRSASCRRYAAAAAIESAVRPSAASARINSSTLRSRGGRVDAATSAAREVTDRCPVASAASTASSRNVWCSSVSPTAAATSGAHVGELRQGGPAPERQSLACQIDGVPRVRRKTCGDLPSQTAGDRRVQSVQVHVQGVPGAQQPQTARGRAKVATQPRDQAVHRPPARLRRIVRPERVQQGVRADHPPTRHRQHGQHRTTTKTRHVDLAAIDLDPQRPENRHPKTDRDRSNSATHPDPFHHTPPCSGSRCRTDNHNGLIRDGQSSIRVRPA